MSNKSTLEFHGGAGSVTGANFVLTSGEVKLMVDCGLFQGCDFCSETNFKPFPYNPKEINVLLVTHAHIDHIGRIPRLVREGFTGRIISTEATRALAKPLLMDSMQLLSREAEETGRQVLYTEADVERAMKLWETCSYEEKLSLQGGFTATFLDAGHILGSSMVRLEREGRSILFTGDLGNDRSLLVGPTALPGSPNYLITESVYGDKKHTGIDTRTEHLEDIIESTLARGGTLLIPAFSTERTQDLIYEIRTLSMEKRIPETPVYIDSPLASRITEAFSMHPQYFRANIRKRLEAGEDVFAFPNLHFVADAEESKKLHRDATPKIIIAGSGMSHGGRILSHELAYLPDARNTLLIVGYQAAGSLGRRLLEGEKQVKIFDQKITVRASVEQLYGYSAHRDGDGLLSFVDMASEHLEQVFVSMGEPKSALALVQRVRDFLGINAVSPEQGSRIELSL